VSAIADLLGGIGLLVFAVIFIGWVLLRPLKIPADVAQ